MIKIKEEKGSITAVVTVTILFCLVIASTAFAVNSARRSAQLKSQISLKETYEKDLSNLDEIEIKLLIPDGYYYVGGTKDTGIVISDSKRDENKGDSFAAAQQLVGNQYVWIEVPKITEVYSTAGLAITTFTDADYTNIENDLHTYTNYYRNGTTYTDTYYSDATTGLTSSEYSALKKNMLKSVYTNGGFWIGRYETGDSTNTAAGTTGRSSTSGITGVPVIKANQQPYTYVTCKQSEDLAKTLKLNNSKYTTSLMFGVQWDLVLKYIEEKEVAKGTVRTDIQSAIKIDSSSWGNYSNVGFDIKNISAQYSTNFGVNWNNAETYIKPASSVLLTTGATNRNSKQNIYDVAGNVWERTLEYTFNTNYPCSIRGARYGISGSSYQAFFRNVDSSAGSTEYTGYRIALY